MKTWSAALLAAAACFLLYAGALSAQFVGDDFMILHRLRGLSGPFDVDLRWRPDIGLSPDLSDAAKQKIEAQATLPVAVREQLGLELQSRRAPVTLVVVESIAPPTPD